MQRDVGDGTFGQLGLICRHFHGQTWGLSGMKLSTDQASPRDRAALAQEGRMLRGWEWEGGQGSCLAASGCRWRENGRGLASSSSLAPPHPSLLRQAEGLPDPRFRLSGWPTRA